MSRSKFSYTTSKDPETIAQIINNFCLSNGFKQIESPLDKNPVYKKGTGALTAMQFLTFDQVDHALNIYGWVQVGIGNVGAGEMQLSGFTASIPKKSLIKKIQELGNLVK
ncbi:MULTISPECIES: hypothetical protein [Erysipelotrichaceae]|uniref:Uncharacterized protein n=1 Tax=Dubosiella newyorkensis TaxID=1862672 RepID=A0A1U7NMK9_9FIRM|nr:MULTISPECIES: hypothetical protein [Erysipelotrichaceae]OLU46464.1 hypothetical protein BO225_06020 [Dubosiella newyorkensis]